MGNLPSSPGRRNVLGFALAAVGWAVAFPLMRQVAASHPPSAVARGLTHVFTDVAAARRVGSAVLQTCPPGTGAVDLIRQLAQDHPDFAAALSGGCLRGLRERLRDSASADFASGLTLVVEGWVLSRVEAHACALTCFV